MKMVKSLLLGAAAGTVAVVGAQAADLPVKAKPVEYVKVCSLYGAGFYYVPGTDTCIKFGGYVRVQLDVGAGSGGQARGTGSQAGEGRNTRNDTSNTDFRNRIAFDIDARSQTAYGTLRSYARFGMQQTTPGNSVGGTVFWDRAFIQFAGFTIGHAVSFFDNYGFGGAQSLLNVRTDGSTGATGITIFAYTYQFGNGFSASISAEDPSVRQAGVVNLDDVGFPVYSSSGSVVTDSSAWSNRGQGQRFWDIVGQLRLDQSWGYIGVSGALADSSGGLYTCNNPAGGGASEWTFCGNPGNKIGWAASAGGQIKMPFAPADSIGVNFVYAKGATGYATNIGRAQMYSSDPGYNNSGWGSVGFGAVTSAVYAGGSDVELTTAWSINAGYEHVWNPSFRQVAHFGYVKIDYNQNATYMICNTNVGSIVSNCNPDWSFWQAGLFSKWTPVRGLDVGVDVFYTKINTAFEGNAYGLPANGSRPYGDYRVEDQGQWSAIFRVQRNFP